jgi:hypothetical protein
MLLTERQRAAEKLMARKTTKQKSSEPSLRDKLSDQFLRAFESDFSVNGVQAIEQLRVKHPEKFCEIATRLIAASEPKPNGFDAVKSMSDMGKQLLLSVHCPEDIITDNMITEAIAANDVFVAALESIKDKAQENGYDDTEIR